MSKAQHLLDLLAETKAARDQSRELLEGAAKSLIEVREWQKMALNDFGTLALLLKGTPEYVEGTPVVDNVKAHVERLRRTGRRPQAPGKAQRKQTKEQPQANGQVHAAEPVKN